MADVNAKTVDGVTPLMMASSAGQRELVRQLLDAKVDVNAKADNGGTALMVASEEWPPGGGASPQDRGRTFLKCPHQPGGRRPAS